MTTTTTTPQPDRITAQELREQFHTTLAEIATLREEYHELREAITEIRDGLRRAATPPAQVGTFSEMMIETIVMTYDDNGKPAYKGLGAPFQKFGVRIWDEVLPIFADPATLKPGKNAIQPTPARVLMNTPEEGKTAQPRKITGKI